MLKHPRHHYAHCLRRGHENAGVILISLVSLLMAGCANPDILDEPIPIPTITTTTKTPIPKVADPVDRSQPAPKDNAIGTSDPPAKPPQMQSAVIGSSLTQAEDWDAVLLAPVAVPGKMTRTETDWNSPKGLFASRLGTLIFFSDGSWVRINGTAFQYSDGRVTEKRGDTYFHADGSWRRRVGNTIVFSDGRRCAIANNVMSCP